MAESAPQPMMQRAGPVIRTIKLFLVTCTILLVIQIWLNPPERRGKVACWPAYKLSRWVVVDGLRTFAPKEHAAQLKTAIFMEKAFHGCIGIMEEYGPGFKKSTKLPSSLPE